MGTRESHVGVLSALRGQVTKKEERRQNLAYEDRKPTGQQHFLLQFGFSSMEVWKPTGGAWVLKSRGMSKYSSFMG